MIKATEILQNCIGIEERMTKDWIVQQLDYGKAARGETANFVPGTYSTLTVSPLQKGIRYMEPELTTAKG